MAVEHALGVAERLRRSEVAEAIRRERAVAIMRRLGPALVAPTVEALLVGGFRIVEFTVDSPDVLGSIARWCATGRALVGAGTVRVPEDVDPAVEAGARFLVSPTTTRGSSSGHSSSACPASRATSRPPRSTRPGAMGRPS